MADRQRQHRHRKVTTKDVPFFGCCRHAQCNPAAHGGIAVITVCSCGATRTSNYNGNHYELGEWVLPY